MPSKICSYGGCKAVVSDGSYRCPKHPTVFTPKNRINDWQAYNNKRVYDSTRWKKTSRAYRILHPLCEDCLTRQITTPAALVDHIIEIQDGGPIWETKNHRSLCTPCHAIKTGSEARKRHRRKKLNGFNALSDF